MQEREKIVGVPLKGKQSLSCTGAQGHSLKTEARDCDSQVARSQPTWRRPASSSRGHAAQCYCKGP